jgi:hypothetical protein
MLKVVNLFGAPGTGKSTLAAGLFNIMKTRGHNVELVTEYAKDLTWKKDFMTLQHQPSILAEQDYRLYRLRGQVEWAISDSPIPCQIAYMGEEWLKAGLDDLSWDLFERYTNFNVLVERGDFPYVGIGRNQTAEEASVLDNVMDNLFHTATMEETDYGLEVKSNAHACWKVYHWLMGEEHHGAD